MPEAHMSTMLKGLSEYAFEKKGLGPMSSFSFSLLTEDHLFAGGICGFSYYGCHYIDLLYVDPIYRGQGYGHALLEKVEQLGKDRQCKFISVNTMDWEARSFYELHGFTVEFIRSGYENDSQMAHLIKSL